MSNIPSWSDLETDNASIFTGGFSLQHTQYQRDNESGGKSGQYPDEVCSPETSTKRPGDYQAKTPQSEDIYPIAVSIETDAFINETGDNSALKMTVATDNQEDQKKYDCENVERMVTTTKETETITHEYNDGMVQLNDAFHGLKISEENDQAENIEEDELDALEVPDEDGDTLLHQAVIMNKTGLIGPLIQVMVESGLDLNTRNLLFQTALHLAVITGQLCAVAELVGNGADVTVRDKNGRTPFHIACEMKRPDIVDCLLPPLEKRGSFRHDGPKTKPENVLDIKNYEGEACVHIAAKRGDIDIMKCLFKHGANGNLPDEKSGRTALHFAAENSDKDMVEYLLGVDGINASPETMIEETPILLAYLRDLDEIVELFKAKQNT